MNEELESSFIPLAKSLEEYIKHHLDVITDSDWFDELVQEKVDIRVHEIMNEEKK
tara:strand:+ start:308 stop:472 length:165 start_codon:yes stop_codon:yes gene_type:complete